MKYYVPFYNRVYDYIFLKLFKIQYKLLKKKNK
jgi:hypothetical protein